MGAEAGRRKKDKKKGDKKDGKVEFEKKPKSARFRG